MRKNKPVHEYMSRLPAEVDRTERSSVVVDQMREEQCHHVPVMDGSPLFGILSREDLHEPALRGNEAVGDLVAGDVCTRELLTVGPLTPVVEVARSILERRVGSALATDGGVLVGIFTATDALRLIAEH